MKKPQNISLFAVIAIWSFSPIIVRGFKGGLHPAQAASFVVIISAFVTAAYMFTFSRNELLGIWAHIRSPGTESLKLFGMGILAFFLYPLCYFNGIHSDTPIGANILNYTWPIVLVLAKWVLVDRSQMRWMMMAGLLISCLGALIATGTVTGFRQLLGQMSDTESSVVVQQFFMESWLHHQAYFYALGGAVIYGVYSALLSTLKDKPKQGANQISAKMSFCIMLFSAALVHILWQLLYFIFLAEKAPLLDMQSVTVMHIVYMLLYACINLALANMLWVYVQTEESEGHLGVPSAPATYLIFVFGTILLGLSGGKDTSNADVLCGAALVLSGVYITAMESAITPASALVLGGVLTLGLSVYFRPLQPVTEKIPVGGEFYLAFLGSLTAVFAILSAFVLQRLYTRGNEMTRVYLGIFDGLSRIKRQAGLTKDTDVHKLEESLTQYAGHVARLHINRVLPRKSISEITIPIHDRSLEGITNYIGNAENKKVVEELVNMVQARFREWNAFELDSLSSYERLSLWTLFFGMLLLLFHIDCYDKAFLVIRSVFLPAIIVILFAVEDYHRGRAGVLRRVVEAAGLTFPFGDDKIVAELEYIEKKYHYLTTVFISMVGVLILMYAIHKLL